MKKKLLLTAATLIISTQSFGASGLNGDPQCHLQAPHINKKFSDSMIEIATTAYSEGVSEAAITATLRSIDQTVDVLKSDRNQQSFQRPFIDAYNRRISNGTINSARGKMNSFSSILARAEREYGVPKEVLTTFWGLETAFGTYQGNVHTISALALLAHDCRRPHLFRPQLVAAMKLVDQGLLDPVTTTGAWAGEIGQVQMLPNDILHLGIDGDGDGKISLKTSTADAMMSAANMLKHHGWQTDQPWIKEVTVSNNAAWNESGLSRKLSIAQWKNLGVQARSGDLGDHNLPASLVSPQGHKGPKFLVYENYEVFLKWNQSFTYTLSAAHMATILQGDPKFQDGIPDLGLTTPQVKELQRKLQTFGHDIGEVVDGLIGGKTRIAVRIEQRRLGMITDGWPTPYLLNNL
ncbi:MAG: lytic murein transglycosylase [Bdellovibrionales bacterium]